MALRALTLFQSVLPEKLVQRSWSFTRSRTLDVVRRLIAAIIRRFERLLAPLAPAPPAPDRRESAPGPPALAGRRSPPAVARDLSVTRVTEADYLDPGWLDGLLGRVRRARRQGDRDRESAMAATLADLERLIPLLERTGLATAGLRRSHQQMTTLHDPDRESTGFELNMAWVLLERELRGALASFSA
jgi:hypothetical protein